MSNAPPLAMPMKGPAQGPVHGGAFELGVHENLKLEADEKPPRWKRKRALGLYIFLAGAVLPALFMGLGNEFICPFTVPAGQDRDVCCDTLGARKAAIMYTVLCIFYGTVIGYSAKQLIQRTYRGLAVWNDHRRYKAKHGTEGLAERLKNETAEKIRQKHLQQSREMEGGLLQTKQKMMDMEMKAGLLAGGGPTAREQQLQRSLDQLGAQLEESRRNAGQQIQSLRNQLQAQQGQPGSMQLLQGGGGQAQQGKPGGQMPFQSGGMLGPQGGRPQQGPYAGQQPCSPRGGGRGGAAQGQGQFHRGG